MTQPVDAPVWGEQGEVRAIGQQRVVFDRNRIRASKPRLSFLAENGEYLKHLLWVLHPESGGGRPRPDLDREVSVWV